MAAMMVSFMGNSFCEKSMRVESILYHAGIARPFTSLREYRPMPGSCNRHPGIFFGGEKVLVHANQDTGGMRSQGVGRNCNSEVGAVAPTVK